MDARPLIAAQFRQIAAEYLNDPSYDTEDRAGKLLLAAYDRHYLPTIPGLDELVELAKSKPEPPAPGKCVFVPCPANVWIRFCGQDRIEVFNHGDRVAYASDRTSGGIMPGEFPDVLPGVPLRHEEGANRQKAAVCEWLAAAVESTPKSKKAGGGGKTRATKVQTSLNLHAAMAYKADHPELGEKDIAEYLKIPRTTLRGKKEWAEWCLVVENAANSGKLDSLKTVLDKRMNAIVPAICDKQPE